MNIIKNFDEKDASALKTIFIAVHGLSNSKNTYVFSHMEEDLRKNGIGMIRFDLPGHGDRKKEKLTVEACLKSIREVEDYVRGFYRGPISLTGASFGAFLLLRYLDNNPRRYGSVILRAPALYQYSIWRNDSSDKGRDLIICLEQGKDAIHGGTEIAPSVLSDFFRYDIFKHLNIKEDVTLLYGTRDVTISNDRIKELAKIKGWKLIPLDGADHFCHRKEDVEDILQIFLKIVSDKS